MSLLEAIVLGLVQGLTEFLPISSSGHLILVPWLFGWDQPGLAFDAALHLGTLLAVISYFWRDLLAMALAVPTAVTRPRALLSPAASRPSGGDPVRPVSGGSGLNRDRDARIALLVAIGSIPAGLAGFVGQDAIERFFHVNDRQSLAITVIAVLLIGFGLLLWAAERAAAHRRGLDDLTVRDSLVIGVAQALALLPGVSRSGVTITAGLFQGMRRADAARFSFLLGAPIIAVAGLKGVVDTAQAGLTSAEAITFVVGILVSALSGFAAIWFLLRYLQRSTTAVFILYRLGAGIAILAIVASGLR